MKNKLFFGISLSFHYLSPLEKIGFTSEKLK